MAESRFAGRLMRSGSLVTGNLTLVSLAFVAAGCGRGGVGATAVGVLAIDGRPAPAGIRIDFQPQRPGGSTSTGITDARGKYQLFFTAARKGVMPGECQVRLSFTDSPSPTGIPTVPEQLKGLRLPEIYRGEQSPLMRTVKPGHNTIDIEIDTTSEPTKTP
jgi:hypothetical protein